jgi:hypothetical protein
MVIKTSNGQFAGGALDPDQSANISNPPIDCRSAACAQARLFEAEILIRPVHDAGTDIQEQTLSCLGCIAQLAMRSSERASRHRPDAAVLASTAAFGSHVQGDR